MTPSAKRATRKAAKKKAPARSTKRRATREPAAAAVSRMRTLGGVGRTDGEPGSKRKKAAGKGPDARAVLRQEFERVLAMKEKLTAEAAIGGKEKGRAAHGQAEKMRGLVSSLEGMNRFALKMGLITPAESRALYTDAMKRGLHEGTK